MRVIVHSSRLISVTPSYNWDPNTIDSPNSRNNLANKAVGKDQAQFNDSRRVCLTTVQLFINTRSTSVRKNLLYQKQK